MVLRMKCVSKDQYLQIFVLNLQFFISNFQSFEVVGRGSETQLQKAENWNYI